MRDTVHGKTDGAVGDREQLCVASLRPVLGHGQPLFHASLSISWSHIGWSKSCSGHLQSKLLSGVNHSSTALAIKFIIDFLFDFVYFAFFFVLSQIRQSNYRYNRSIKVLNRLTGMVVKQSFSQNWCRVYGGMEPVISL